MKTIVFGGTGLLGSAIARNSENCIIINSKDFDATNYDQTRAWFESNGDIIKDSTAHICSGKVSGIGGQRNAAMFVTNMRIAINLINLLAEFQTEGRTIYYSSSCVYPQHLDRFNEEDMFAGPFEPTNEGYALAKAAGQKLAHWHNQATGRMQFITIVPPNLYGDNDNWNLETSHVLPALAQKILAAAKTNEPLKIWGVSDTRREFMRSDDVAHAAEHILAHNWATDAFNVGMGEDISIGEVVQGLCQRFNYQGNIEYTGQLVGKTRKLLNTTLLDSSGWKPKFSFDDMLDYIAREAVSRDAGL